MRLTGQHPRLIHDTQHAPSLACQDPQITQPRRAQSQPAVVVLDELTETVELVVSEIVTNAVKASGGLDGQQRRMETIGVPTVRLWLAANEHAVLIQVWDGNDWQPQRREPGLDAEDGRGLLLVEALTTQWGSSVQDGQPGKTVWALIETAHLLQSSANARRLLESLDQAQRRPRPTAGVGAGP
jgi:hypothetical protein